MKKKYFIIILLVILFCSGCDGTITRKIRQSGFSVSDSVIECPILINDTPKDGTYDKIRFLSDVFAISETGNIYELSLSGVYSNDMNCKKAGKGIKAEAIYNDSVVRSKDGNYYYLFGKEDIAAYSKVNKEDQFYTLYKELLADDVIRSVVVNTNSNEYYVLKEDGNVYKYVFKYDRETGIFSLDSSDEIVYSKSKYGKILDFDYVGETVGTYIRSEDGYYRYVIDNLEECSKYVDIDCQYSLKKDEALTEYKDRIIAFSGTMLITDYGRVFTVTG